MPRNKPLLDRLFSKFIARKSNRGDTALFWKWFWHLDAREQVGQMPAEDKEVIAQRLWSNISVHTAVPVLPLRAKHVWMRRLAVASLIAGVLISGLVWLLQAPSPPKSLQWSVVATDGHSIKYVELPDGTRVTLDINSTLAYSNVFNEAERLVRLTGQGRFEVHKDPLRPFLVQTGELFTKALGTAFNVEYRPDEPEIRIALTEGKVAVRTAADSSQGTVLTPGEILHFTPATRAIRTGRFSNDAYTWIQGGIAFHAMPLADALDKISKKYSIDIRYDKTKLAGKAVTASFGRSDWQKVLDGILYPHGLQYTTRGKMIMLKQ